MTELNINLYEAYLPTDIDLVVRTRPDKLLAGELLLGHLDESLSVVVEQGVKIAETSVKSYPTFDLNPFLVQRLLTEGLATSFSRKHIVERETLSFNIFDPKDKVKVDVDFIDLLRGVSFRAEHVTSQGKSHYGFYCSMRVRRKFNESVQRGLVLQAAIGEDVRVVSGTRGQRAKLLRVDSGVAQVETRDFDTIEVKTDDVHVGATPTILARYAQSVGQPDATSRVIIDSQVASFRYSATGSRVRSWLKSEVNFVGSWLARVSQNGRLPFTIPNSESECYVGLKPALVKERSR